LASCERVWSKVHKKFRLRNAVTISTLGSRTELCVEVRRQAFVGRMRSRDLLLTTKVSQVHLVPFLRTWVLVRISLTGSGSPDHYKINSESHVLPDYPLLHHVTPAEASDLPGADETIEPREYELIEPQSITQAIHKRSSLYRYTFNPMIIH
jgi:hypothetical protein